MGTRKTLHVSQSTKIRIGTCLLSAALVLVLALSALADFSLEFCDDIGKSPFQQRDPYEERIETERHDFTQSAVTVGRHVFQIESGYSFFYRDNVDETEYSHTAPEMLVRISLREDIEFRARWNHVWQTIEDEPNDIVLGVLLRLTLEIEAL